MPPILALVQAVALAANPVPADPPMEVDSDLCSCSGTTVRISLVSPTGRFDEDDMTLVFEKASEKAEVLWPGQWMLDPADPKRNKWKISTICKRADAVVVDRDRVLFFVSKSGRPNADRLVAVLYDVERATVLDFADVGPQGDLVARDAHTLWFREMELGRNGQELWIGG